MTLPRCALVIAVALSAYGCSAAQPACAVVDIADHACSYLTVEHVDPDTGERVRTRVPRSELEAAAMRARAAHVDGGTP